MTTEAGSRAAAIEALTASLNAGLDEDEAAALAVYGFWRAAPGHGIVDDSYAAYVTRDIDDASRAHVLRQRPARALRDVKAKRDLIAAILAESHDWNAGDEFYSCSQAADYADPAAEPGSGCSNPDRRGQPCDCGRDARVERLLRILAGIYEDGGGER